MLSVSRSFHSKAAMPKAMMTLIRSYASDSSQLRKTPLHELHLARNGQMVDYSGFDMPVLYKEQTHIESHNWVRQKVGLFDVSHMLQHRLTGPGTIEFLESITPADLKGLKPFHSTLSVLLNEKGGVIDDTIISKHAEDDFYVVTNAGCIDKDLAFLKSSLANFGSNNVKHEILGGGLLALQGPLAAETLQKFTTFDLSTIKFGQSAFIPLEGGNYHVARGGYTGEDGFEIAITDDKVALDFGYKLLDVDDGIVKPIGLAARDSLRLEAGLCLYGHELEEDINPVEAALTWVIGKRRRTEGKFNGSDIIIPLIPNKTPRVRTGLVSVGPSARGGSKVFSAEDPTVQIGVVTSGSFSPTLKKNVAQVYLDRSSAKAGTAIKVEVRGKLRDGQVTKLPFVPTSYFK